MQTRVIYRRGRVCGEQVLFAANGRHKPLEFLAPVGRHFADERLRVTQGKNAAMKKVGRDHVRVRHKMREIVRISGNPLGVRPLIAIPDADEEAFAVMSPSPDCAGKGGGKTVSV